MILAYDFLEKEELRRQLKKPNGCHDWGRGKDAKAVHEDFWSNKNTLLEYTNDGQMSLYICLNL